MSRALVVGGTGSTGPYIVNALLADGYEVVIFHTGTHEVDFDGPVEHRHGDARDAAKSEIQNPKCENPQSEIIGGSFENKNIF